MKIICPHCGKEADKATGAVNRARKVGLSIYCSGLCAALARREWKDPKQKKAEKAEYDRYYRTLNYRKRKEQKAAYHKRTYDPVAAAKHRKGRMPRHLEYCRQPKYRAYKKRYDRERLASLHYGEYAEAALLLRDIDQTVNAVMTDYEVRIANGTINKRLKRKREYAALISGRT